MAKNGFSMSNRVVVEELESAKTVSVDDCGKVFILAQTAGLTASLPQAAQAETGWNCSFVVSDQAAANKSYKIVLDSASPDTEVIVGTAMAVAENKGTPGTGLCEATGAGSATKAIYLEDTEAGGMQGSRVDLYTDGGRWFAHAVLHASGSTAVPLDLSKVFRNS